MKLSKKWQYFNVEQGLAQVKGKANELLTRALDQQVTLAVTGLSRSGKTAFISSLVNQLINEGKDSELAFFEPIQQERFVAAKRIAQQDLHVPRFAYEQALSSFAQQPPNWPVPTKGVSQIKLALRYRPASSLLKYATDMATLYLTITDYPGEWLLDLPMLEQTFEEWSEQMTQLLQQAPRAEKAAPVLAKIAELDAFADACEEQLAEIATDYTDLLHYYRNELGLSVIQPGRFILPGELEGAPILQFFPYPNFNQLDSNDYQNAADNSNIGMLRARFIEYKQRVVKHFYQEYFKDFDRQIVLADCLTPLNNGADSFNDLSMAINMILSSFRYGKGSLLSRLFSPKIDRLLFAATKADHLTPEQHGNLTNLLEQLLHQSKQELNYHGIDITTMAIAAVNSTKTGQSRYQGKAVPVLQGRRLDNGELITVFPGALPSQLPTEQEWPESGFSFIDFAPMAAVAEHKCLPHLRLDQAMQFLLGDKMA